LGPAIAEILFVGRDISVRFAWQKKENEYVLIVRELRKLLLKNYNGRNEKMKIRSSDEKDKMKK